MIFELSLNYMNYWPAVRWLPPPNQLSAVYGINLWYKLTIPTNFWRVFMVWGCRKSGNSRKSFIGVLARAAQTWCSVCRKNSFLKIKQAWLFLPWSPYGSSVQRVLHLRGWAGREVVWSDSVSPNAVSRWFLYLSIAGGFSSLLSNCWVM